MRRGLQRGVARVPPFSFLVLEKMFEWAIFPSTVVLLNRRFLFPSQDLSSPTMDGKAYIYSPLKVFGDEESCLGVIYASSLLSERTFYISVCDTAKVDFTGRCLVAPPLLNTPALTPN